MMCKSLACWYNKAVQHLENKSKELLGSLCKHSISLLFIKVAQPFSAFCENSGGNLTKPIIKVKVSLKTIL